MIVASAASAAPLLDLEAVLAELAETRRIWRESHHRSQQPGPRELPSRDSMERIVGALRGVLFPMRLGLSDLRHGAILGGSVWVTEDVPPNAIVSRAHPHSTDRPPARRRACPLSRARHQESQPVPLPPALRPGR